MLHAKFQDHRDSDYDKEVFKAFYHISPVIRKPAFAYAKTKTQISFAVTAKLISVFVCAIRKVQFLFYLNTKFQASSHILSLCSLVCVRPGRKPRRPVFSERGSYMGVVSILVMRPWAFILTFVPNSREDA